MQKLPDDVRSGLHRASVDVQDALMRLEPWAPGVTPGQRRSMLAIQNSLLRAEGLIANLEERCESPS